MSNDLDPAMVEHVARQLRRQAIGHFSDEERAQTVVDLSWQHEEMAARLAIIAVRPLILAEADAIALDQSAQIETLRAELAAEREKSAGLVEAAVGLEWLSRMAPENLQFADAKWERLRAELAKHKEGGE